MANTSNAATNTGELPQFSVLKPFEQRTIVLRAEGKTSTEITNQINAEFELAYKKRTIEEWFYPDGRLLQAYLEYNGTVADLAVEAAKTRIKKASEDAADTLVELMSSSHEGSVRVRAALGILAKYVPDRQIIQDGGKASDLPASLTEAMDKALDEPAADAPAEPAQEPTDEPPASPEAN